MELQLALKGLEFAQKKKKWVALMAAFGLTSYGFYRVYHFPAIAQKRNRVLKLLGALVSITEAVSGCAETIRVVSNDLNGFLQSELDQIPNSLKQVSKITRSNEFSQSIARVTQGLTVGILRGYQSEARSGDTLNAKSSSMDQVMDKLFTEAGAGFASAVVGSFARNLVMAACKELQSEGDSNSNSTPFSLNLVWCDEFRELIGDCIQVFVSSMVGVYLEKTKDVNTFDEFFAGLTNPNHATQLRNLLVTTSNGAMEALVKTSHQVLTNSNGSKDSPDDVNDDAADDDGWVRKVSSTLLEPRNKKFVVDMSGRIAFETVRAFLEALLDIVCQGMKKCVKVAHEAVVEGGLEIVRYVSAKSSVVATICLSLCLHILGGVWILVPAQVVSPSHVIL
ncbi:hypothetical protein Goklo_026465 [Gossypium klotzschianum]|uniref:Protein PHLOEM PROTEIN 2-LIKE A10 n=1 Tax=Gossypium klotzschianum TaxID=34286 RepID=A0A7J8TUT7_9ROSI|nr:hypothetical protein [Gossypium klotzschianum]